MTSYDKHQPKANSGNRNCTHLTVKPSIIIKVRLLEQCKLGAIHHEVPIPPLSTNIPSHPFLCTLLLFECGKMDEFVMQGKQSNHDTIS